MATQVSSITVKGKVGNIVGMTNRTGTQGGNPTARIYVIPKNPRTREQMLQRMLFATATQTAARLFPLINHSFEGTEFGEKSRQKFISENLAALRAVAKAASPVLGNDFQFALKGISSLWGGSWKVSKGSLPAYTPHFLGTLYDGGGKFADAALDCLLFENTTTDPGIIQPLREPTLIEFENMYGIGPGMQLTLACIRLAGTEQYSYQDDDGYHDGVYQVLDLQVRRIRRNNTPLETADKSTSIHDLTDALQLKYFTEFDADFASALQLFETGIANAPGLWKIAQAFGYTYTWDDDIDKWLNDLNAAFITAIKSDYNNEKPKRSSQSFIPLLQADGSLSPNSNEALRTWLANGGVTVGAQYLDGGGWGGVINHDY